MPYNTTVANKENYTFRFDPDLIARIDAQARREQRSRTNMIEVMASDYLRECAGQDTERLPLQRQP